MTDTETSDIIRLLRGLKALIIFESDFMPVIKTIDKSLLIRPVLDQGFIIFVRAHYNGVRMVSFENPEAYYMASESELAVKKSIVGTGKDVHTALAQALHLFHQASADYKSFFSTQEHTYKKQKAITDLDNWLVSHKGKLRIVSDFDGTVLARLEGLLNPNDSFSEYVVLEASGSTFHGAILSVLEKPVTSGGLCSLKVKIVEASNTDEAPRTVLTAKPRSAVRVYPAARPITLLNIKPRTLIS